MNWTRIESVFLKWKYRRKVIFQRGSIIDRDCKFEGKNRIGRKVYLKDCYLGEGSYISDDTVLKHVAVGKYCSIGGGVKVIFGQHPTKQFVSTHPCFYSCGKQAGFSYVDKNVFKERKYADEETKTCVQIGHDVWIADDVRLLEGVEVGDGAIIAAGSLVVKDVEPFSIVGGVPAKIIRYRFDKERIEQIQNSHWWNKDENWMREHVELFSDVQKFCEVVN